MRTYLLNLSFPPRELNPNVRCHWAVKARCSAGAKDEGALRMIATLKVCQYEHGEAAPDPKTITKVGIKYLFAPPDRRARDDDNLIRCMKPYRDGIALALGVDDKIFRTQECEFLEPHRPAYVRTEVTVYEDGGNGGK